MDTKKLLEILDKNINQEELAKDLAVELVLPLIKKFVEDTSNPYDNALYLALEEFVNKK